jgi:hypothetical protein
MNPKTITIKGITFTKIKPWGDERRLPWIEALESGIYTQAHDRLKTNSGYCCLGVAAEVCGAPFYALTVYKSLEDDVFQQTRSALYLTKEGFFMHFISSDQLHNNDHSLARLNDDHDFSFPEIALFLRWAMLPLEEVAA